VFLKKKIGPMGVPGAWALWAYGPRGQIEPQRPRPQGPGAHGPEIIILMSRMIISRDDKKSSSQMCLSS